MLVVSMCFASLRYSARLFAAVCAFVLFWALVLCCAQLYIMVRHVKFRRTVHLTFTAMGPSSIWRVSDMNDEQQCPNVPIVVAVVCVIYQCSRTWGISSLFLYWMVSSLAPTGCFCDPCQNSQERAFVEHPGYRRSRLTRS